MTFAKGTHDFLPAFDQVNLEQRPVGIISALQQHVPLARTHGDVTLPGHWEWKGQRDTVEFRSWFHKFGRLVA